MTLVQSPIEANWVIKQLNFLVLSPKTPLFALWIDVISKKTLKSLYLLIFEDVFEALVNVTNWFISSVKTKRVCCGKEEFCERISWPGFVRYNDEALALFGMDEVKLLGICLAVYTRGCQTLFEGSFRTERATAKTEKEFDTIFKAFSSFFLKEISK